MLHTGRGTEHQHDSFGRQFLLLVRLLSTLISSEGDVGRRAANPLLSSASSSNLHVRQPQIDMGHNMVVDNATICCTMR